MLSLELLMPQVTLKISSNNFDLCTLDDTFVPAGHINFFASNKIIIEKFGIALLKWVSTEIPNPILSSNMVICYPYSIIWKVKVAGLPNGKF